MLNKIISFIKRIFKKPEIRRNIEKKRAKRKRRNKAEIWGQFDNIKSLLNHLDSVFDDLHTARRMDNSIKQYLKRFGPFVMDMRDSGDTISNNELEGFKAYGTPHYLCCYIPNFDEKEKINIFSLAIKSSRLKGVRKKQGCTYYAQAFVALWEGKAYHCEAGVQVNKKTGEIVALPYLSTDYSALPRKKYQNNRVVPLKKWDYPTMNDHYSDTAAIRKKYIEQIFHMTYNMTMKRELGINIIARKKAYRATFVIPPNEWKRFFRKREHVVINGKKKRIFHAVTAHMRNTKDGQTPIRTHYRGLRQFTWNGYDINIVIQGKHGASQADFDAEATHSNDVTEGFISLEDAAKNILKIEEGK